MHSQHEDYKGNVSTTGIRSVYDEAKRYAEALTTAYHRLDTRIVRIFNSILADEQVLYDDGHELRREKVSDLAARLASRVVAAGYAPAARRGGSALLNGGFSPAIEYPLHDYTVPSFSEGGMLLAAPATALVAHPTGERSFEVRTRYGRSIRVTGQHSIFVENPDGEPVAKFVEELDGESGSPLRDESTFPCETAPSSVCSMCGSSPKATHGICSLRHRGLGFSPGRTAGTSSVSSFQNGATTDPTGVTGPGRS